MFRDMSTIGDEDSSRGLPGTEPNSLPEPDHELLDRDDAETPRPVKLKTGACLTGSMVLTSEEYKEMFPDRTRLGAVDEDRQAIHRRHLRAKGISEWDRRSAAVVQKGETMIPHRAARRISQEPSEAGTQTASPRQGRPRRKATVVPCVTTDRPSPLTAATRATASILTEEVGESSRDPVGTDGPTSKLAEFHRRAAPKVDKTTFTLRDDTAESDLSDGITLVGTGSESRVGSSRPTEDSQLREHGTLARGTASTVNPRQNGTYNIQEPSDVQASTGVETRDFAYLRRPEDQVTDTISDVGSSSYTTGSVSGTDTTSEHSLPRVRDRTTVVAR